MKLAGRVWGGHNIRRFDCARIREAFADCGRAPPTPAGIVDSFDLLNQKFGRRAGNLKVTMTSSLSLYLSLSLSPPPRLYRLRRLHRHKRYHHRIFLYLAQVTLNCLYPVMTHPQHSPTSYLSLSVTLGILIYIYIYISTSISLSIHIYHSLYLYPYRLL